MLIKGKQNNGVERTHKKRTMRARSGYGNRYSLGANVEGEEMKGRGCGEVPVQP